MHITKQRLQSIVLPVILLASAVARLWHIGWRDFWYDEAFTGIVIRAPFGEMMHMVAKDIHPPLYYIAVKCFAAPFQYSIFGIRLYSAVMGVLGVYAVYLLARELFGRRAGLFAAALASIAPFAIQYSQEARMYSQYSFLIILSLFFLIRSCRTGKMRYAIVWGGFFGLAGLTHYLSVLFVPLFILIPLLWRNAADQPSHHKRRLSVVWHIVVGLLVAIVIFSVWLPWASDQFHRTEESGLGWVPEAHWQDTMTTMQTFLFGAPVANLTQGMGTPANELRGISWPWTASIAAVLVVAIVGVLIKRSWRSGLIVGVLVIGPIVSLYALSLMGHRYYVVRYLLPAAYCLYVAVGAWLGQLRFRYVAVSAAMYGIGLLAIIHPAVPHGWNELRQDASVTRLETWYVLSPIDYVIAEYYLGSEHVVLFNADRPDYRPTGWAAIGDSLRSTDRPDELVGDASSLVVSYMRLDQVSDRPTSLKSQSFQLIRRYDTLMTFR